MSRVQARMAVLRLRRQRQASERQEDRRMHADAVCRRLEAACAALGREGRVLFIPTTGRYAYEGVRGYTERQITAEAMRLEAQAAALVNPDEENA